MPGPSSIRRVSVVGNSGSGKTTLARTLARRRGLEHIELDAIFHQPGWNELDRDEFRRRVGERLAGAPAGWVACGNYSSVREVLWSQADTVVWLDLPRWRVMERVVSRTVRRVITREELWNGNREPLSNLWPGQPDSIIGWAWRQHAKYEQRYRAAMADPRWEHLHFVRLRSPAQIRAFAANPG